MMAVRNKLPTVRLELMPEDAEPILRKAAYDAARYGAYVDHLTRRTHNPPSRNGRSFDECRAEYSDRFRRAKRIINAFGVEHEVTSEAETLTVEYPMKNQKKVARRIPGIGVVNEISGGTPDFKKPIPSYRRGVHEDACQAAADRVIRMFRMSRTGTDTPENELPAPGWVTREGDYATPGDRVGNRPRLYRGASIGL